MRGFQITIYYHPRPPESKCPPLSILSSVPKGTTIINILPSCKTIHGNSASDYAFSDANL